MYVLVCVVMSVLRMCVWSWVYVRMCGGHMCIANVCVVMGICAHVGVMCVCVCVCVVMGVCAHVCGGSCAYVHVCVWSCGGESWMYVLMHM